MKRLPAEIYNEIPVFYCKHCLSLRIKSVDGMPGSEYCDRCNSTAVDKTDIFTWEYMYERRYGEKYINLKDK